MRQRKGKLRTDKSVEWHRKEEQYYKNILTGLQQIKTTILEKIDHTHGIPKIKWSTPKGNKTPQKMHFNPEKELKINLLIPKTSCCSTKTKWCLTPTVSARDIIQTPKTSKKKQIPMTTPVKKQQVSLLKTFKYIDTTLHTQQSFSRLEDNRKTTHNTVPSDNYLRTILFLNQLQQEKRLLRQLTTKNITSFNTTARIDNKHQKTANNQNLITNFTLKQTNRNNLLKQTNKDDINVQSIKTNRQLKTCRAFSINYKCDKQNHNQTTQSTKERPNHTMKPHKITQFMHQDYDGAIINLKRQNISISKQTKFNNSIQAHYSKQIQKLQIQNVLKILDDEFEACLKLKESASKQQKKKLSQKMRSICYEIIELREKKNKMDDE